MKKLFYAPLIALIMAMAMPGFAQDGEDESDNGPLTYQDTAANYDNETIHQQNYALVNEVLASIVELRRQNVVLFDTNVREQQQMFQHILFL